MKITTVGRVGPWLTRTEAAALLDTPDCSTLRGLRDRAAVATMPGAGLRRTEATRLTVPQLRLVGRQWALVDVVGKGGRARIVPVAAWVADLMHGWTMAAAIASGPILRHVAGDVVQDRGRTSSGHRA